MNGSLVCFSSDNFETFFFATVTGKREPEQLAVGRFQIRLEVECQMTREISPTTKYAMIESKIYFEV